MTLLHKVEVYLRLKTKIVCKGEYTDNINPGKLSYVIHVAQYVHSVTINGT